MRMTGAGLAVAAITALILTMPPGEAQEPAGPPGGEAATAPAGKRALGRGSPDTRAARGGGAAKQQLESAPKGGQVAIRGTATKAGHDRFTLDYGSGEVQVDMAGWDWYQKDPSTLRGRQVTVTGAVDDGLFRGKRIKPTSIYVGELNRYFYAQAAGAESGYYASQLDPFPQAGSWIRLEGTVRQIKQRNFLLDTGQDTIKVDAQGMSDNPFDDDGGRKIVEGDRVAVAGTIDKEDVLERQELQASAITLLSEPTRPRAGPRAAAPASRAPATPRR